MVSQTIFLPYAFTKYTPIFSQSIQTMLSQSIPLYFHKAPIRIYNKIINKKGKFWRLCSKKITIDKN